MQNLQCEICSKYQRQIIHCIIFVAVMAYPIPLITYFTRLQIFKSTTSLCSLDMLIRTSNSSLHLYVSWNLWLNYVFVDM